MSAYGYDSRRRRRARRRLRAARARGQAAFWLRVLVIAIVLAVASFAIVSDRLAHRPDVIDFPLTPRTPDVTTTLRPAPHVADTGRNAARRHP